MAGIIKVLGVAGSISTLLALAALAALIAYLLAAQWQKAKAEQARQAIASGNNEALSALLGGTRVPLDDLTTEQKYGLASADLSTRARQRTIAYAFVFFAFLALLAFILAILFLRTRDPDRATTGSHSGTAAVDKLDPVQALKVLGWVPVATRAEVCGSIASAATCTQIAPLLEDLAYKTPTPVQREAVEQFTTQGGATAEQRSELAACGGSFHFTVDRNMLRCVNGVPVPSLMLAHRPALSSVDAIVFHSTGEHGPLDSVVRLIATGRPPELPGPLSHLIISRGGAIVQVAPFNEQAVHAGRSAPWAGIAIGNRNSVAIELENDGAASRQPFTAAQVNVATGVARALVSAYPIKAIVGHADIAPGRKTDPGPLFPLVQVKRDSGFIAPAS